MVSRDGEEYQNWVLDVTEHAEALSKVFDVSKGSITYTAVAYKPQKERMPPTAAQVAYECSVANLGSHGIMDLSPWRIRSPSEERRPVNPMSVAIFAFRHVDSDHVKSHEAARASPTDAEHEHVAVVYVVVNVNLIQFPTKIMNSQ